MADLAGARPGRLVRLHRTLEDFDPWDLLPRLPDRGWAAAWWDPIDDRGFAALGLLAEIPLDGEVRFESASAALGHLNPVERGDPVWPMPCALAGFAFRVVERRSEQWRPWGDGRLFVPRLLVHRIGHRTCAVASTWLDEPDADAALEETLGALESWRRRPAAPVRTVGGAARTDDGTERARWDAAVGSARRAFAQTRLDKVVLARRAEFGAARHFDPVATVLALREQQPDCTTFMIRHADGDAFVGATPEELARVRGRDLATVALAGTRKRDGDDLAEGAALLHSDKDLREHGYVVEAILASLDGVTDAVTASDHPSVAPFAQVQHLRTPIRARLADGVGAVEVAARLHPTPAVGGVPRDQALHWLDDNEPIDRGWYAGPIGWLSGEGDGVLVVAIRSALLSGGSAAAWAGCGLVEGSEADAEWRETEAKLAAVHGALVVGR